MTQQEAIARVDALLPNTFSQTLKELWLEQIEELVRKELAQTHQSQPQVQPGQLSIPAPYDECYIRYLEAQIHYAHGEMTRYANAMQLFNSLYAGFAGWYNRNFLPCSPEGREVRKCAIPPI